MASSYYLRQTRFNKFDKKKFFLDKISYLFILIYFLAIPIPSFRLVGPSIRDYLFHNRSIYIAIFITISFLAYINHIVSDFRTRTLLVLSLAHPLYYLILSLFYERIAKENIILYLLWPLYTYSLAPMILREEENRKKFVSICKKLLIASLAIYIGVSILKGVFGYFKGRLSFGFKNPLYYSQIPQAIIYLSILEYLQIPPEKRNRGRKFLLFITVILSFYLCYAARARNNLVAILAAITFYFILKRTKTPIISFAGSTYAIAALSAIAMFTYSIEEIDDISSDRSYIWRTTIKSSMISASDFIFGAKIIRNIYHQPRTYSDLERKFSKFHIDNVYIEQFLESGIIGIFLFLLPILFLTFRYFSNTSYNDASTTWIFATSLSVLIQGIFATTFPTFNSPIGFLYSTILIPHLVLQKTSHPQTHARHARQSLVAPPAKTTIRWRGQSLIPP